MPRGEHRPGLMSVPEAKRVDRQMRGAWARDDFPAYKRAKRSDRLLKERLDQKIVTRKRAKAFKGQRSDQDKGITRRHPITRVILELET